MCVSLELGIISVAEEQPCVEKLAQLLSNASPLRIPVQVSTLGTARRKLHERTVIQFGTAQEVVFASTLPLEFEDRVHLRNSDGSLDTDANVVAVRYQGDRKAIAARFVTGIENWVVKS